MNFEMSSSFFSSLTGTKTMAKAKPRELLADRRRNATQLYLLIAIVFLASAVFDLAHSIGGTFILSELEVTFACILGAFADYGRRARRVSIWLCAYGFLWVSTILGLAASGGAESPFFSAYIVLLLLCGICLLPSVRPPLIFRFVGANVAGWLVLSAFHVTAVPYFPHAFMIKQSVILAFAVGLSLSKFLISRNEMSSEFKEQTNRLLHAENELIHADKMAEVGKLVATTAHELAQPTQVIVTIASLLSRFVKQRRVDPETLASLSERLLESSERLSRLLGEVKNFSRKETSVAKVGLDLRDALQSVRLLTQHDLRGYKINYRMEIPSHVLWTYGDAHRLQQVFLNLIINARDATLSVSDPWVFVRAHVYRSWTRVTVSNNGAPIPLDVQAQLFKPYFTTKSRGKGTGLGLSICQHLIEEHDGRIMFSSSPEETIFVVDLPRKRDVAQSGLHAVVPGESVGASVHSA
jgi:signal transduction histidine kinase